MIIDGKSGFFIKKLYATRYGVMRYFGVKRKSYAGSIIQRIYDYYCMDASSVFLQYIRYYKHEFDSYDDFLIRKYNFFPDEILHINKYLLFYKNLNLIEDSGILELLYDEDFKKVIIRFLGGIDIEN